MDGFGLVDRPRSVARRRAWPGGAAGRQRAARWLAPAVFLLAVTGALLLVRSALREDEPAARTNTPAVVRKTTTPRVSVATASVPRQYYVIGSGDTLDAIAAHFGTTTAVLLGLNPGVEPTALHTGQRVRVK